jgi:hypothetical protein
MKFTLITLISFLLVSVSYAQKLDLFQEIEVQDDNEERVPRSQQNKNIGNSPVFIVKGISRFGDKYLISLLPNNGDPIKINWSGKTSSSLKGFPGYSIIDANSRTATLTIPQGSECIEFPDKGIKCNGPYMLLSMANEKPISQENGIKKIENVDLSITADENETIIDNEEGRFYRNPFSGELQQIPDLSPEEQAVRDERRQRRAELFRDFEVVRIPDEEIPEGMQRVRTPFGDSLEPIGSE